ncbi:MAG: bifunctional metallophosphatase/5'-nucleotidase [Bacteroidales bacterium]|nr:bifunctional metallophosphatase/5'-nucleotidase [Bacteroidales bacterium]
MKRLFSILIVTLTLCHFVYSQSVHIKLIETTDVHGAIFPYDFVNDTATNNSLAQVYTYVKKERKNKEQEVILLDNGDILQGQPVVYYYNFENTSGTHICSDIMNFMNYDAATVGNHDIEAGHEVYDKIVKEFNFPWLAANAVNNENNKPYFQPYYIINKKGIKIAIFGLITPGIPKWLPENIWKGIYFEDMIESAAKWVKIINENEKPDILVGLFHSGIDYTYGNVTAETYKNENATKLVAEKVSGFDIIFAGHDHDEYNFYVNDKNGNKVLLLDAKSSAKLVAVADIYLNYDTINNKWTKSIKGNLIDMTNYLPDKEFMEKFSANFEEVKKYVSEPIGTVSKTIHSKDAFFGDSEFIDLIHNVQLEITKADISFTAPLNFNTKIDSGEIYVRDMFKLYRFENLLYTMELNGKEIKDYLEYACKLWFNTMKNPDDHLIRFKNIEENSNNNSNNKYPVLYGNFYNYDSAEGIIYEVDVSKPDGNKVNIISMSDGSPFDYDKKYKVALNSYRGNGGGYHLTKGAKILPEDLKNRILFSTDKDFRYYMMEWIKQKKIIDPEKTKNWKIIPVELYENGKQKDCQLLFGK